MVKTIIQTNQRLLNRFLSKIVDGSKNSSDKSFILYIIAMVVIIIIIGGLVIFIMKKKKSKNLNQNNFNEGLEIDTNKNDDIIMEEKVKKNINK